MILIWGLAKVTIMKLRPTIGVQMKVFIKTTAMRYKFRPVIVPITVLISMVVNVILL